MNNPEFYFILGQYVGLNMKMREEIDTLAPDSTTLPVQINEIKKMIQDINFLEEELIAIVYNERQQG
jgi:hypothetical protein|nr:MAG TPA: hypothetical protein [Caudoviricetes sp.]DAS08426.1 MAG TPA: hypothetical protein [Caudoviricetes sp.]